jgi:hypothetical protein
MKSMSGYWMFDRHRGIPNALFLNGQGKQTIPKIVAPLRRLGIPTIAIVDIDVLRQGGHEWTKHLEAVSTPNSERQSFGDLRATLWQAFEGSKNPKREGGIDLLDKDHKETASNLFDRLQEYGLFVVRRGEVESWLESVGACKNKSVWLGEIFDRMGDNPESPDYVKPGQGDVWDFIASMRHWLTKSRAQGNSGGNLKI